MLLYKAAANAHRRAARRRSLEGAASSVTGERKKEEAKKEKGAVAFGPFFFPYKIDLTDRQRINVKAADVWPSDGGSGFIASPVKRFREGMKKNK